MTTIRTTGLVAPMPSSLSARKWVEMMLRIVPRTKPTIRTRPIDGDDEAEDVAGSGAEGHADAEFAGAARDAVGDDAEDADAGECEADSAEDAEEEGGEFGIGDFAAEELFAGANEGDGLCWSRRR